MKRRQVLRVGTSTIGLAIVPGIIGTITACKKTVSLSWSPRILSTDLALFVEHLTAAMLPTGSEDLKIPQYIDTIINDCMSDSDQTSFVKSIQRLMAHLQSDLNINNISSSSLKELDRDAFDESLDHDLAEAYKRFKSLTLSGFYTSESVMTNHLDYHPIPGEYQGCTNTTTDTRVFEDDNV